MEDKIQKKIDFDKWLDSEKQHKDMCGSYDFCKYCDIKSENPCATAISKIQVAQNETAYRKTTRKKAVKTA